MPPHILRKTNPAAPARTLSPSRTALINTGLSVLQTIVIAVFGFLLTGRLDLALKEREASLLERQATVKSVAEMKTLLENIMKPDSDSDQLQYYYAQLAMYGSDAIFPLFVLAAQRSKLNPDNAITALRLLAVQHRQDVCTVLLNAPKVPKVINQIRKESIADLTADLGCYKQEHWQWLTASAG